jgi:hypothetical protein
MDCYSISFDDKYSAVKVCISYEFVSKISKDQSNLCARALAKNLYERFSGLGIFIDNENKLSKAYKISYIPAEKYKADEVANYIEENWQSVMDKIINGGDI